MNMDCEYSPWKIAARTMEGPNHKIRWETPDGRWREAVFQPNDYCLSYTESTGWWWKRELQNGVWTYTNSAGVTRRYTGNKEGAVHEVQI